MSKEGNPEEKEKSEGKVKEIEAVLFIPAMPESGLREMIQ